MSTPATVTEAPESFAAYVRAENAKEQAETGDERQPLPVAEPMTADEATPAAEAPVASTTTDEGVEAPTAEAEAADKPKRDKVQERIDRAIKLQREAERRADAAEARAREIEARTTPVPVASAKAVLPSGAPKLEDFINDADPLAAFTVATAQWAASTAIAEREQQAAAKAQETEMAAKARQSDAEGRKLFQDWDEVINGDFATTFAFPSHVIAAIRDSDQSAALRYYLASHPEESRVLAADPPTKALVTLGMIAARLTPASNGSGGETVVHSQAKPLTKPLRGSSPSAPSDPSPDPDKTPFSDWVRIQNAADRRRMKELRGA